MLNTEVVISETNLRDIILSSLIFPFYPYSFYKTVKKIITDQKNTQSKEEEKLEENTKLALNEFNLEGWSEFITETPYSDIPEDFDFPPGHPLPGKLYRAHS